jgi:hypothetical protein
MISVRTIFQAVCILTLLLSAAAVQPVQAAKPSVKKCSAEAKAVPKRGKHWAYASNSKARNGSRACGFAWGQASIAEARRKALYFCRREEKIPPPVGIKGTCRIRKAL